MRVYVVMGNDFPDAVFSSESEADAYCARQRTENPKSRVYWRSYDFVLDDKATASVSDAQSRGEG